MGQESREGGITSNEALRPEHLHKNYIKKNVFVPRMVITCYSCAEAVGKSSSSSRSNSRSRSSSAAWQRTSVSGIVSPGQRLSFDAAAAYVTPWARRPRPPIRPLGAACARSAAAGLANLSRALTPLIYSFQERSLSGWL